MKLTVKIKLHPTKDQAELLRRTIIAANECGTWIAAEAWKAKIFGRFAMHPISYHQARKRFPELSSTHVVRATARVFSAYAVQKRFRIKFRPMAAISFDDNSLSWKESAVSILSVNGREKMPFSCSDRQRELLKFRQGESDLIYFRKRFYIAATINAEEPTLQDVEDFLGADFGITNILTDSEGKQYSGSKLNGIRRRHNRFRRKLQKANTRSAIRHLRKLSGKEQRFAADVNHCISKTIVDHAKGTRRGIAIENLKGISTRVTVRLKQRSALHSWAFHQLRQFIEYKAKLAGVILAIVDPRNSSRQCSQCGHISKANRPNQSTFLCQSCGFGSHADYNAAANLRARGRAAFNQPIATPTTGQLQAT